MLNHPSLSGSLRRAGRLFGLAGLLLFTLVACQRPSSLPGIDAGSEPYAHFASPTPDAETPETSAPEARTETEAVTKQLRNLVMALDADAYESSADQHVVEAVRGAYEASDYKPIWYRKRLFRKHKSNKAARAFDEALDNATQHGLTLSEPPMDLLPDSIRAMTGTAADDLKQTFHFIHYVRLMQEGQVDPSTLSSENNLEVAPADLVGIAQEWVETNDYEDFLADLQPKHPEYQRLLEAMATYEGLAQDGGWPEVTGIEALEPGERHPEVNTLRKRLALTGDLLSQSAGTDSLYDQTLAAAVARFQERHGLAVDSVVGPSTLEALNVPVEQRLEQLQATMERWRWLPQDLGERFVLVNIPAYTVYGYDESSRTSGRPALEMNVVVGSAYGGRNTPVFTDEMEHVIFRPYWNLPMGIAANEVLPKAREDASYLQRNDYEFVNSQGQAVSPSNVDLNGDPLSMYRMRQKPGPSNALGLVKYMFPNRYAIYLHDTPADHLFDRPERDFSHGCIRLADPARFGAFVLGPQGWSESDVRNAMNTGDRQQINLDENLPVYIVYHTASVDDTGTVHFYDDIYGYGDALNQELAQFNR